MPNTIQIHWKSTGALCTTFRSEDAYLSWLRTAKDGVTNKIGSHPSVDLRDVKRKGGSISNDFLDAEEAAQ